MEDKTASHMAIDPSLIIVIGLCGFPHILV